jgi:hypothetical protein
MILHQAFATLKPQHALWIDSAGENKDYQLNVQLIERRGRTESATWFRFPGGYIQLLAIWRAIRVARLYRTLSPDAFKVLFRSDPPSLD